MKYPFLTLDDQTEIVHSEMLPDGKIQVYIEKPDATLKELFKTSEDFITRNYIVIENDEITIWTKESFPISYFSDKM